MCPQCGTRAAEWDPKEGGDEDAYLAALHKCVGCEVIADKQAELGESGAKNGMQIYLQPYEQHAALTLLKQLTGGARDPHRFDHENDTENDN